MFHHQTQGSCMCLPYLHRSSLTQGTLSPFSIFDPILYLTQITFPSSSHASCLLCSIFTREQATSQVGGLFHSRDSPISNLPSSYKSADSTCQVRDSTSTQLKTNSFSAANTAQLITGMNNQKYRTTLFSQNQTQPQECLTCYWISTTRSSHLLYLCLSYNTK